MTWGPINATNVDPASLDDAFDAAVVACTTRMAVNDTQLTAAALDQVAAVKAMVKSAVQSGAIGAGLVSFSVQGHACTGHQAQSGGNPETFTVQVTYGGPKNGN